MAQAQTEYQIVSNSTNTPLVRLQAMLLKITYAMHGENTSRIVTLCGSTMSFATLHGFHELPNCSDEESLMRIRAWSSLYAYVASR
jgi:hypothetical protein